MYDQETSGKSLGLKTFLHKNVKEFENSDSGFSVKV